MIWIIIAYVIGVVASAALMAWILKNQVDATGKIMLDDVILTIVAVACSWLFVIGVFVVAGILVGMEKARTIKVYERKKKEKEQIS